MQRHPHNTPASPVNRNAIIAANVVLFHVAALWALQTGLLRRAVEIIVPAEIIAEFIEPPIPKVEPPPPPKPPVPVKQPVIRKAEVVPPPPMPVAISDPAPAPNAPTGVTAPQPSQVPGAKLPTPNCCAAADRPRHVCA